MNSRLPRRGKMTDDTDISPQGEQSGAGGAPGAAEQSSSQYVTFELGAESFALPMGVVREIIRVPDTVRVPMTPPALLGLANLRGSVLPVLETCALMQLPEPDRTDASRVVVACGSSEVGLLVDRVHRVVTIEADALDRSNVQGLTDSPYVEAVARVQGSERFVQVLSLEALLASTDHSQFSQRSAVAGSSAATTVEAKLRAEDSTRQLVTLRLAGEEYAMEIASVEEIVRVAETVQSVPGAAAEVIGMMNLREGLIPLYSLRAVVGLAPAERNERQRVVVLRTQMGQRQQKLGLVVDEVQEVITVRDAELEPMPESLGHTTKLQSRLCRKDGGRRIITVLDTAELELRLARSRGSELEQGEQRQDAAAGPAKEEAGMDESEIQLVVFSLDGEEYGAGIEHVSEIVRVPEQLSRAPGSPHYIEGVTNLRGSVLPVVDLRARFGLPRVPRSERQRILVLEVEGQRTGYVVDSVTEVMRLARSRIEPAPKVSSSQEAILGRVVNLQEQGRIVMVVSTSALVGADVVTEAGQQAA
jgi:purine-binding chemotaxis protein CheW